MGLFIALAALLLAVPARAGQLRVGESLPVVSLPNWQGQTISLHDFKNQVVIVDFWASWCATCRAALPALDAIGQRHAGQGLVVAAINIDGTRANADRFLAESLPHPAMTLLHDPDAEVLARFGAQGMPALYVLDRTHTVRLIEVGCKPEALQNVERVVRELMEPAADAAISE